MKKFLLLFVSLTLGVWGMGQTTLINPTGDGGFETGSTFVLNNWTAVNGFYNNYYVGSAPVVYNGNYCAFTGTSGSSWTGTANAATNHIYRDVTFPSGETSVTLKFYHKFSVNESGAGYDFLKVFLVSTSTTPVAGTELVSGQIGTTVDAFTGPLSWTLVTINLSGISGIQRLVFSWKDDGVAPHSSIALDNIELTSTLPPPPLTGTKTIKTSGGDYATFTAAINALNIAGVGTNGVTFNADAGFVSTEDCPAITATGTTANQIVFQKSGSGANPIIKPTGTVGASDFGICISGGDYITFDGIDITIATGSAVESGYLIRNASATDGAQYNTIKNSKITLNKTNTSSKGILQTASSSYGGGFSPSSAAGSNSYNKYYNNTIENVNSGIWLYGSSSYLDASCEIGSTSASNWTTVGSSSPDDIGGATTTYGINLYYQNNYAVFNTEVRNVTASGSYSVYGIYAAYCNGSSSIYNCKFHDIKTTATTSSYYVYGISDYYYSTSLTTNIYNNIVYALNHGITSASATFVIHGIYTYLGNANLYYNSIRIDEDAFPTSVSYYNSGSTVNVKNNIFANYSTAGATSLRYCWYNTGTVTSSSNNVLYIASGTNNYVGYGGSANRASLELFAASISGTAPVDGMEGGSANYNPGFTGTSDLTLLTSSPARSSGTPIASPAITTDIAGVSRDATRPNIGAYETSVTQTDKSAPVISGVSITSGLTPVVSCVITDNSSSSNNATIRLWYRLSSGSGAYTPLDADSKPGGAMNGTYTWNTSLSGLATGNYNFYIAARDDQGAGSGIWVNPLWTTGFAGFNAADPPTFTANPDANANVRTFTKQGNLSGGPFNVGTGETRQKLTDVANELNASILQSDIIYELTSTYDGTTGETFPITFNQFSTSGGSWTVTIRVKASAGARTTSGSSTTDLIYLNGADNITFDGRENGSGSTKAWTFSNTSTSGTVFNFKNDATYNSLKYLTIQGVTASTSSGVVYFGTTTGTTGNDNNTLDYCDIRDGASTPYNGIYASGTTTTSAHYNSNVTISNCNIYNFAYLGGADNGMYISSGNTDWTITGNSLYQTATRTNTTGTTDYGMYISNSGNNFTVSNNYIGGQSASCGGGAWTVAGAVTNKFVGMYLYPGVTTATSVQGNTINNFDFSTTSGTTTGAGSFCCINVAGGNVNIGNTSANTIGSATVDKIKLTSTTAALLVAINSSSTGTVNISGNTIYGMTSVGSGAAVGAYLTGIQTSGSSGNYTINSNTIGSTSVANSMRAGVSATTTAATYTVGINNSATGTITISQTNVISNLTSYGVNTSSTIRGVISSAGTNTITQNTVRDLYTPCSNVGTTSSASVIGIMMTSSTTPAIVSQNTVFSLNNTHASAAVCVTGIHYAGPTTGTNVVARNFIHSLSIVSTSASSDLRGLYLASGLVNFQNNMVALGNSLTTGIMITGIYDFVSTTGSGVYHNSVYIGGTGSSGTAAGSTFAFRSDQTTNTRTYANNVFVNARSNGTTTAKHYAVRVAGTGVNPTGLTINFNIYQATGTGAVFGYYGADIASIAAWKTATGQDGNSGSGDPKYIDPTASTPNLLIQASPTPTPVEGTGTNIASVTDDFEGQTRSTLTPVDIGADAGNFTASDIFPPVITYIILGNTASTSDRTLAGVTITDASGVPTSGSLQPRIYYKKNSGSWFSSQGTLTSGSATNGIWSFNIVAADLSGLAVTDIVSYYVIAQDVASTPNIGSSPSGVTATDVNTVTVAPASPNTYTIVGSFSGAFNVGPAEPTYTSLTGAAGTPGGFFAAINAGVMTGNITVNITGNITESGTNALNQWAEDGAGGYTMTIQPSDAVTKTLSGTYAGGLIRLNGADRVTFNGNFGGSGQYLTFSNANTGTSNNTLALSNTANNNNIKNCKVYSKYRAITTTAADNTLIEGNEIYGDVAGNSNFYQAGVYITASSTNSTVRKNVIHDFYYTGTTGYGCFGIYYAGDATTVTEISNNIIYAIKGDGDDVAAGSGNFNYIPSGISIFSGGNVKIYYNSINLTGAVLGTSYNGNSSCIMVNTAVTALDIRNNNCKNSMTGSGTNYTYGIVSYSANTAFTNINNNNYFVDGTGPNIGFLSSDRATLAAWRTASGQDANSVNLNPNFTSATNLIPTGCYYYPGAVLSGVTTDIAGTTRAAAPYRPDMGAYEKGPSLTNVVRWLGTTSTDWAVATNWDKTDATTPNSSDNVWLPTWGSNLAVHVTSAIAASAASNKLNIYSGTSLTIDAGKGLTVSGTLTNTPGISGLVVKSGGSLIQSTGSVAATVERTITGWNNYPGNEATHGWHLLSSPTTAQTIQNEFVPAVYTANEDFYAWWETTNQWVNFKNTTTPPTWNTANVLKVGGSTVSGGTNFIPAKGYLVAYASDPTKQFTVGSLNTGDYAISELGISTGANYGWHLLGNPFPSALSWGTAGWLLSNIQATAKIWKESTAGYIDIQYGGPNEIIPALNGFMVEVSSGSGSLTIPAAARVHNGSAWYKSTDNPVVLLLASDPAGQTAQESVIRFEPGATGGFDPAFDAHFLAGYAPRFYSVSGDEHLSTNALPEMGGSVQIPFDFIKTDGVNFTIEAKMISGIWGPVILNDLKTGANQDLTANPVYAFTSAAGDNPARFLINFNHVGIPETQKDHSFTVYASDNILFVVDNTGKNQGNVFVYNLIGQLIASAKLNGSSTCNLNLNVPTGYYLVRIVSPETTQTSKIFIR